MLQSICNLPESVKECGQLGMAKLAQGHPMKPEPLTDAEFDRLNSVLARFGDKHSMNLEKLDGLLAALICGPDTILPSEYLPVIWGDAIVLDNTFKAQPLLHDFMALIMRHWNAIADTLHSDDVYLPLLFEDENGISHGNDWANGFLRGMELRKEEWADLLNDEQRGGWLVPILALAHEHNLDLTMRPYSEPISTEMREKLIVGAAAGVVGIYRHFQAQRLLETQPLNDTTVRRMTPKIGRNDPCPCGSGKKFKQCCSTITTH
jgi:uncharacterized protein